MTSADEQWKPALGFEGDYVVSDRGRVARISTWGGKPKWKIVAAKKKKDGYIHFHLCRNGIRTHPSGHRLVWQSFNGPVPQGLQINHINSDRADNNLHNLEAVTASQNIRQSFDKNGRISPLAGRQGERATRVKLTNAEVIQIRAAAASGTMLKDLAVAYGVTAQNIGSIVSRRLWRHI